MIWVGDKHTDYMVGRVGESVDDRHIRGLHGVVSNKNKDTERLAYDCVLGLVVELGSLAARDIALPWGELDRKREDKRRPGQQRDDECREQHVERFY